MSDELRMQLVSRNIICGPQRLTQRNSTRTYNDSLADERRLPRRIALSKCFYFSLLVPIFIGISSSFASAQNGTSEQYKQGSIKGDDHYYSLKSGYIFVCRETDTSFATAVLQHGNTSHKLPRDFNLWVWLEMDGNNYFMTGSAGRGSCDPEDIKVFKKSTGAIMFSTGAFVLYADTLKGLVVFDDEGREKNDGFFIVYSLNTNTYETYKEPSDGHCACCANYWKVIDLTNTELKISYSSDEEKNRTVTFTRNSNK